MLCLARRAPLLVQLSTVASSSRRLDKSVKESANEVKVAALSRWWVKDGIDSVNNSVVGNNIRLNDLGVVDKQVFTNTVDLQFQSVGTLGSSQGSDETFVKFSTDNVVQQDVAQFTVRERLGTTNSGKGFIGRSKDRERSRSFKEVDKVHVNESVNKCAVGFVTGHSRNNVQLDIKARWDKDLCRKIRLKGERMSRSLA